jgi:hypothetical protein
MTPRQGRDTISVELHEGPAKPPHRPWVEPYVTNHLLYAPVSRTARTITIEAVDRFGRTYSTTASSFARPVQAETDSRAPRISHGAQTSERP